MPPFAAPDVRHHHQVFCYVLPAFYFSTNLQLVSPLLITQDIFAKTKQESQTGLDEPGSGS